MNKLANEHVSGTINANENSSKSSQVLINDIISLSLFLSSSLQVQPSNKLMQLISILALMRKFGEYKFVLL